MIHDNWQKHLIHIIYESYRDIFFRNVAIFHEHFLHLNNFITPPSLIQLSPVIINIRLMAGSKN